MTTAAKYRALVVDDEMAVLRLLMSALQQAGFQCDSASDGIEAEQRVSQVQYDAVVTDLRMPNKHGHALATHLLTLKRRPVIIVHTGMSEPKLIKDLLARGVDDIIIKPFNFTLLAVKVKALVERRFAPEESKVGGSKPAKNETVKSNDYLQEDTTDGTPVPLSILKSRLSSVSQLLPISTAALEVYKMTGDDRTHASQLAAAIQRDAAFAAEVLRLANSAFYNSSQQPVVQLDRAVVRIGQKRIGELALGMNALAALTSDLVPWMDVNLAWKQSMAAGLAVEMLIEQGGHQAIEEGLLLSAIMHPLGRVALGTLYPRQYEKMVKQCQVSGESLQDQENIAFPLSHTEVLAHLLASWNVPAEVQSPIKFIVDDYAALVKAPEPTRSKVELVKLAIFIGRLAVGRWESWDVVQVPPVTLLKRLGVTCVTDIIEQTRADVEQLASFHSDHRAAYTADHCSPPSRELGGCDLSGFSFDFFGMILPPMGIKPVIYSEDDLGDVETTVFVNCIGTAPHRLAPLIRRSSRRVIITDTERAERYKECGRTIVVPCSYGRLRSACWEAASTINQAQELADSTLSTVGAATL